MLRAVWLSVSAYCCAVAAPPHIIVLTVDDWGYFDVGYRGNAEALTPNIDALVASGIRLDRHYVYKFCSPSRSAFQTGRNPIHVNVLNLEPWVVNSSDPVSGFAGIPVNMTTVAEKMSAGGYRTAAVGKWDVGMASQAHTPVGRGFHESLGYFVHANDYWTAWATFCPGAAGVQARRCRAGPAVDGTLTFVVVSTRSLSLISGTRPLLRRARTTLGHARRWAL